MSDEPKFNCPPIGKKRFPGDVWPYTQPIPKVNEGCPAGHIGDPGPPGVPATPFLEPYKSYQDMGGKLTQPEFWDKLSDIRRCQERLCGIPEEGVCKDGSLLELWLSIWGETHSKECYPDSQRVKRSSFLAGTQTKEVVFLQLVSLARDLFCFGADQAHGFDTIQMDFLHPRQD